MDGQIGARTDGIATDWRRVEVTPARTTAATNTINYWGSFDSTTTAACQTYDAGTWSLTDGLYQDSVSGSGDLSVVNATSSANYTVQGDLEMNPAASNVHPDLL